MRALMCLIAFILHGGATGQVPGPAASCQILVDPVDFGAYSTTSRAPNLSVGRIELRCITRAVTPDARVTLSPGNSGHYQDRTLTHGADRLVYNLYVDPGRQNVAGDGTQGTYPLAPVPADAAFKDFRRGLLGAARAVFRIYGRIDAGQAVPGGEYTDNILVIVEF
jgi:spore coat protein U-like protein